MQFPDGIFNGVIILHVIEHVDDQYRALAEVWRVLAPGGWALVEVSNGNGNERGGLEKILYR